LALSRNDISFTKNAILISNSISFQGNAAILKPFPKTNAGFREIPMPTVLREYLKVYLKQLDGLFLFEMNRKQGLMTKSSYNKFWKGIILKLNTALGGNDNIKPIQGLTAYTFRHNYATMLYYAGIDIKEAQYLLGHENVEMTLDIYTHLEKSKSNAAKKLDDFIAM